MTFCSILNVSVTLYSNVNLISSNQFLLSLKLAEARCPFFKGSLTVHVNGCELSVCNMGVEWVS